MPRRKPIDWEAVRAAAQPHSVITRWQLNQLGVTDSMIWERVRPGGVWRRLLPGVVSLHNGDPTWPQLVESALRYARRGAMVSGLAGARLHGLRRLPPVDRVHLLVARDKQPQSYGHVIIERTRRLPQHSTGAAFPWHPSTAPSSTEPGA